MDQNLEQLIAQIAGLPIEGKRRLVRLILESLDVTDVRDSSATYGEPSWVAQDQPSSETHSVTSVTIKLPDELARRAQEAGLLSEARLAELISGALKAHGLAPAPYDDATPQRRLVRQKGRLVAESLPGEQPISDAEVRVLLNTMEW